MSERPECPEQFRPGMGLIAEKVKRIYCEKWEECCKTVPLTSMLNFLKVEKLVNFEAE